MKWGVQQVRVTLESDSGETLVVEQNPDGSVVCQPGPKNTAARKPAARPDKPAHKEPAKPSTAKSPKADKPPTRAKPERPPTRAPKSEKAEAPAKPSKPERKPEHKPAAEKPVAEKPAAKEPHAAEAGTTLGWQEIADHGYTGIAARARWGVYKALRAKTTATYALFFEAANQPPHHIGCFRTVDEVRKRAQQIHDSGWPPQVHITTADIEGACPAPTAEPKPARGRKPRTAKTPDTPAEPQPTSTAPSEPSPQPAAAPPAAAPAESDQDRELMSSFAAALAANIPEEDD